MLVVRNSLDISSSDCFHSATCMAKDQPVVLCVLSHFSVMSNSWARVWIVAHQPPLSMGFSRQEYWRGLLCPPPGDLPNLGIEPSSPMLQAVSLQSEPPGTGFVSNLVSPPLPTCASGARHYRTHSYQQKTSDPALWCHKVSWICLVSIRRISGSHAHSGPFLVTRQGSGYERYISIAVYLNNSSHWSTTQLLNSTVRTANGHPSSTWHEGKNGGKGGRKTQPGTSWWSRG